MLSDKIIKRFKAELIRRLCYTTELHSTDWEKIVAYAVEGERQTSDNYLADVTIARLGLMVSVKSRWLRPVHKKKVPSFDLSVAPPDFVYAWERRIQTPRSLNLTTASAKTIGDCVLADYFEFEKKSQDYYDCNKTLDFCIVHGANLAGDQYLVRLIINTHNAQLSSPLEWRKTYATEKSKNSGVLQFVDAYDPSRPERYVLRWTTPHVAHTTRSLGKLHAIDLGKPKVHDIKVLIPRLPSEPDDVLLARYDLD